MISSYNDRGIFLQNVLFTTQFNVLFVLPTIGVDAPSPIKNKRAELRITVRGRRKPLFSLGQTRSTGAKASIR